MPSSLAESTSPGVVISFNPFCDSCPSPRRDSKRPSFARSILRVYPERSARPPVLPALQNRMFVEYFWWTRGDSNPRPPRCERGALPAELLAHEQQRKFY